MIKFLVKNTFKKYDNYNGVDNYNFLVLVNIDDKDISKDELLDKLQNYLDDLSLYKKIIWARDIKDFLDGLNLEYEIVDLETLDCIEY